jgi:hypothetical protein
LIPNVLAFSGYRKRDKYQICFEMLLCIASSTIANNFRSSFTLLTKDRVIRPPVCGCASVRRHPFSFIINLAVDEFVLGHGKQ